MDKNKNSLIGYDIRVTGEPACSLWPLIDKKKFLLRPDVLFPYSCDINAWPSVFDILDDLNRPTAFAANAMFWDNLEYLQNYVHDKIPDTLNIATIAITYSGSFSKEEMEEHYVYLLEPFRDINYKRKWRFIGFDVTDNGFESATSGMGHIDFEDKSPAFNKGRMEFKKYINQFHLFDSMDNALDFCQYERNRVPEHVAFFPFGIWLLDENFQRMGSNLCD